MEVTRILMWMASAIVIVGIIAGAGGSGPDLDYPISHDASTTENYSGRGN